MRPGVAQAPRQGRSANEIAKGGWHCAPNGSQLQAAFCSARGTQPGRVQKPLDATRRKRLRTKENARGQSPWRFSLICPPVARIIDQPSQDAFSSRGSLRLLCSASLPAMVPLRAQVSASLALWHGILGHPSAPHSSAPPHKARVAPLLADRPFRSSPAKLPRPASCGLPGSGPQVALTRPSPARTSGAAPDRSESLPLCAASFRRARHASTVSSGSRSSSLRVSPRARASGASCGRSSGCPESCRSWLQRCQLSPPGCILRLCCSPRRADCSARLLRQLGLR